MWGCNKWSAVCNPEEGSPQNLTMLVSWSDMSRLSGTVRKRVLLFISYALFVVIARANSDRIPTFLFSSCLPAPLCFSCPPYCGMYEWGTCVKGKKQKQNTRCALDAPSPIWKSVGALSVILVWKYYLIFSIRLRGLSSSLFMWVQWFSERKMTLIGQLCLRNYRCL